MPGKLTGIGRWGLAGIGAAIVIVAAPARAEVLVSVSTAGAPADWTADQPAVDGPGRVVAFRSGATNLAPPCGGPGSASTHVYVRDVAAGTTECASVSTAGQPGDDDSYLPAISRDGRLVVFESTAGNLDPACPRGGVFLRDRGSATTSCLNVIPEGPLGGGAPAISGDGRVVAFEGQLGYLLVIPPCDNERIQIWVRDLAAGTITCASLGPAGSPSFGASHPSLSADGRRVLFASAGFSPSACGDPDGVWFTIYLRDLAAGTTTCVSRDANDVPFTAHHGILSGDGRTAAMLVVLPGPNLSTGALVPGPAPCPPQPVQGTMAVVVRDLATGRVTCLTDSPFRGSNGDASRFDLQSPSLSHDGAVAAISGDHATYCEAGVHLFRPGAAPPLDRDCLVPVDFAQIRLGWEVALSGDGRRAAVTMTPLGGYDYLILVDAPSPDAPQLWLTASQTTVRPGDTLVVTAFLQPGQPGGPVDVYVVIREPLRFHTLSVLPVGIVDTILEEPFAVGVAPFAYQGEIIRYTFTGAEPPGDYRLLTGLVASDTGALVGDLEQLIIHVLPATAGP